MADDSAGVPVCFVRSGDMPGFAWGAYAARVRNPFRFTPVDGSRTWEALRLDPAAVAGALREVYEEEAYLLTQADIDSYPPEERSRLLAAAMAEMPVAMAAAALPRHGVTPPGRPRTVGRRRDAYRLIGGMPPALGPNPVVVFVVDTRLDAGWMARVAPGRHLGSFGTTAGALESATDAAVGLPRRHAHVTVRNVLAMAPEALIVDVPLLPATITDFTAYLSRVHFAFRTIRAVAAILRTVQPQLGVVVVNAWAVYDSARAKGAGVSYLTDRTHVVNAEVIEAAAARIDYVFAAGNTSRLIRDPRVGAYDGEPYRSIYGANALPEALCVTSVRVDGLWPGHASRGPEAPSIATGTAAAAPSPAPGLIGRLLGLIVSGWSRPAAATGTGGAQAAPSPKPDIAIPAEFAEDDDAGASNLGTSAACGLGAGVVAAARTRNATLASAALFGMIAATARPLPPQNGWNNRLGHGVIDVSRLWPQL
jgi:hypothetical protein